MAQRLGSSPLGGVVRRVKAHGGQPGSAHLVAAHEVILEVVDAGPLQVGAIGQQPVAVGQREAVSPHGDPLALAKPKLPAFCQVHGPRIGDGAMEPPVVELAGFNVAARGHRPQRHASGIQNLHDGKRALALAVVREARDLVVGRHQSQGFAGESRRNAPSAGHRLARRPQGPAFCPRPSQSQGCPCSPAARHGLWSRQAPAPPGQA